MWGTAFIRVLLLLVVALAFLLVWLLRASVPAPGDNAAVQVSDRAPMASAARMAPAQSCEALRAEAATIERLDTLDARELDAYLADLHETHPDFEARLRNLALARLGVPYALGTLGEESAADPDPVFRLDEADCTVLVLTTTALAHARSLAEARAWMGPANYHRQGDVFPVRYENRLHFTADRLQASPMFVDLTAEVAGPGERRRVELVLNRKADGAELLPIGWERSIAVDYVPAESLAGVLERLPAVAGIAFVRESMMASGLIVAHEGILLDQRCLVHASSLAGNVAIVDVRDYLWRRDQPASDELDRPRFDGAILYGFCDASSELELPVE